MNITTQKKPASKAKARIMLPDFYAVFEARIPARTADGGGILFSTKTADLKRVLLEAGLINSFRKIPGMYVSVMRFEWENLIGYVCRQIMPDNTEFWCGFFARSEDDNELQECVDASPIGCFIRPESSELIPTPQPTFHNN
ncbi:MAG: hypothetical protein WCO60_20110 [Verrucomicrobiota bacterium]